MLSHDLAADHEVGVCDVSISISQRFGNSSPMAFESWSDESTQLRMLMSTVDEADWYQ